MLKYFQQLSPPNLWLCAEVADKNTYLPVSAWKQFDYIFSQLLCEVLSSYQPACGSWLEFPGVPDRAGGHVPCCLSLAHSKNKTRLAVSAWKELDITSSTPRVMAGTQENWLPNHLALGADAARRSIPWTTQNKVVVLFRHSRSPSDYSLFINTEWISKNQFLVFPDSS